MSSPPLSSSYKSQAYNPLIPQDQNLDDLIDTLLSSNDGSSIELFEKATQGIFFSVEQLERLGDYLERPDAINGVRSSIAAILGEVARNGHPLPHKAIEGLRLCIGDPQADRPSKEGALLALYTVAVGTLVTQRPPHRSVRAVLPHTAPTLSVWRQNASRDSNASALLSA